MRSSGGLFNLFQFLGASSDEASDEESSQEEAKLALAPVTENLGPRSKPKMDDSINEDLDDFFLNRETFDEAPDEEPEVQSDFQKLYRAAFYSEATQRCCNENSAKQAFEALGKMADRLEGMNLDDPRVIESILPLDKGRLRPFFKQWESGVNAHEKIAAALSLKEFVLLAADYFEYRNKNSDIFSKTREGEESGIQHILKKIPGSFLPKINIDSPEAGSTLKIILGEQYVAYFKVGALRLATDQALHALGEKMGQATLFAAATPLRIYPSDFKADIFSDWGNIERFSSESGIRILHRNLSKGVVQAEKGRRRENQTFLFGSLQPEYEGNNTADLGSRLRMKDLLISLSVAMMLNLRDIKGEDIAASIKTGMTFLDAETPLIPENPQLNMPKFDIRFVGQVFHHKPKPEDWQALFDFLSALDEKRLCIFLKSQNFDSLKGSLVNYFGSKSPNSFYTREIDGKEQPELQQYAKLDFTPSYLFSKTQIEVFASNLRKLKAIETRFQAEKDAGKSILQLMLAFDRSWVERFVAYKLYHAASPELGVALFVSEKWQDDPGIRRVLKTSVDKSSNNAGHPDFRLPLPRFSGRALSARQRALCKEILGDSLSDEELGELLGLPKEVSPSQSPGARPWNKIATFLDRPSSPVKRSQTPPAERMRLTPAPSSDE